MCHICAVLCTIIFDSIVLNTAQYIEGIRRRVTAPEGAGSLKWTKLHDVTELRIIDNDDHVFSDYHDADPTAVVFRDENNYALTSHRDGSESAEKIRSHDRFGLPVFRQFSVMRISNLKYECNNVSKIRNASDITGRKNEQTSFDV